MFTIYYNGMYINGYCDKQTCYITDDYGTYKGIFFSSLRAAKILITKARNNYVSR